MIRTVKTRCEGFGFLDFSSCYNLVIILSSYTDISHVVKQLVFLKRKLQWALVPAPSGHNFLDQDLLGPYWSETLIPIPKWEVSGSKKAGMTSSSHMGEGKEMKYRS